MTYMNYTMTPAELKEHAACSVARAARERMLDKAGSAKTFQRMRNVYFARVRIPVPIVTNARVRALPSYNVEWK